jgi:drug/metabolite transporter (DMT)-like permease
VGAAAIFARYALGGAGPLAISALRLCIAAALLWLLGALRPRERTTARERALLWSAGLVLAIHFASWIWSLEYTTVAISTLLVCTSPLWTALYDTLVRARRFPPAVPLAFCGGIAGLAMIVGFNHTPPPQPGHEWLGAALAIAGSVAFAAYLLLVREVRAARRTQTIVTHTYTAAAVVLALAAIAAHQPPPPIHAAAAWGGILAMALISQLLGHTAMNAALRWFSPSAISFSTLLEPVVAALLAVALFGEALSALALAGGVLLLLSIGTVLWIAPD